MRPNRELTHPGRTPRGLPARFPARLPTRLAVSLAASLAISLTLSACGTLGPDSAQQRADTRAQLQANAASAVPAAWPVAAAAAASAPMLAPSPAATGDTPANTSINATPDPTAIDWPALVQDARLSQVITLALQANRDLRVAVLTLEQARATYRIQEAATGPTLNANAGLSASRTPAEASSSGQDTVNRTYSAGLGISAWEIDLFNRVGSLKDSALQAFLASEATQRSTRLALVADVATAWLTLSADQQLLALYRQTLASQQHTLSLTEKRQALGAVSGLTVAQTRATVESARANVATYESQVQRDRTALELLAGQRLPEALLPPLPSQPDTGPSPQGAAPMATSAVTMAAALVAVPEGLPSEVLRRRPDVQAAEAVVQGAQADLAAARAALYPRITLTASAGTASRSLEDLFQGGAWSFAPSVTLPLLDGGAARTTAQKAEITRDLRLASYDKTVQTAFKEVADALSVRASLQQRLSAQQALVEANAQAVRLSQARWQAGADGYLTLLDAQRSLLAAQQGLISLQLTEQANRVTLFKVLGGA